MGEPRSRCGYCGAHTAKNGGCVIPTCPLHVPMTHSDKLAKRIGAEFVPFDASGPEIKPMGEPVAITEEQSKSLYKAMLASFDEVGEPVARPVDGLVEDLRNAHLFLGDRMVEIPETLRDRTVAEILRLRSELARKDEALRAIADEHLHEPGSYYRSIARAALRAHEGEG